MMQSSYVQKNTSAQSAAENTAASVLDNSLQSQSLQRMATLANGTAQRASTSPRPNNTGLPDSLKNNIESLSGYSLDSVRVHYNSSKPAAVQAYAYTQGTDIHIAPGQEKCLPHEAWHVTQQMSGRVSPTTSICGVAVNDDASLEHEADVMGARASTLQGNSYAPVSRKALPSGVRQNKMISSIVQRNSGENAAGGDVQGETDCIDAFKSRDYDIWHYKVSDRNEGIDYGHFHAKYSPSKKHLAVILPVHYDDNMNVVDAEGGKKRKTWFKRNVENTWSNRYHIDFWPTRPTLQTPPNKSWENELNRTRVDVYVKETSERYAYFNVRAVDANTGSSVGGPRDGKINVELREHSFRRGATDGYPTLNPTAHEAGHMFGLDDEYVRFGKSEGDRTDHYNLTRKAFGRSYADTYAVMHANETSTRYPSVMRAGNIVKKHHYVTFWDAMVKAIRIKFGRRPSSKAPNMHGDWTIKK